MKFLITGSEGFFGSHLVEELLKAGHDVRCFVQYNSFSSIGWLNQVYKKFPSVPKEIYFGDVRDVESINKAISNVDICINLAALISIPYSYVNPRGYFETNTMGTLNVLQACLENSVRRVIQVSTSEVYGTPKTTPISEQHLIQAQSPYAASKAAADNLALSYFHAFDLPVVILRPFNLFGPRQSTRAVIPTIITQALNSSEIRIGSLDPRREFNFAPEIAKAFVQVALSDKGLGEVFNVGNGTDLSIKEVLDLVIEISERDYRIIKASERIRPVNSEVLVLQSDSRKINEVFGWSYELRGLEGFKLGLAKTIEWYASVENLDLFQSLEYRV